MEIESDSECIHGLGPIAACVICNGRAKKEVEAPNFREFPAQYPGFCSVCLFPIKKGQMISWAEGELVAHAACR